MAPLGLSACKRTGPSDSPVAQASLASLIKPGVLGEALRAKGGGHYHATSTFRVSATTTPPPDTVPASKDTITTTTDVWLDGKGDFRVLETNDGDGGREVVRVGGEAVVALRYEKGVRRPMLPAEAEAILAEALGAPAAAWEVLARQLATHSPSPGNFEIKRGEPSKTKTMPKAESPSKLRAWRETVVVESAQGSAKTEAGLLRTFTLKGAYKASRGDTPLTGEVAVAATLDELGKPMTITLPEVPEMPARQRTILDERELLGGLHGFRGSTKSR